MGKPEINARRFWGFKALKTLLDKGYTPALSEIEPDTDCSSKPRIFVLWGEKIVFVADIKSGLVSDVPDTNSRMCGPSQPEALSIFAFKSPETLAFQGLKALSIFYALHFCTRMDLKQSFRDVYGLHR